MKTKILLPLLGATLLLAGLLVNGCSTAGNPRRQPSGSAHDGPDGAKLWAQNCIRCHNVRSPDSYSDAHWDVAMMHMRIRANLTADDSRAILEFLKSSN